jgi:hypothetical protein
MSPSSATAEAPAVTVAETFAAIDGLHGEALAWFAGFLAASPDPAVRRGRGGRRSRPPQVRCHPVTAPVPARLLILDPGNRRWILATIVLDDDLRPAEIDDFGRYSGWEGTARWAAHQLGIRPLLTPIRDALAWSVGEDRGRL